MNDLSAFPIRTIALDADDTLWMNEPIFVDVQQRLQQLMATYVSSQQLDDQLYQTEKRNLSIFGYGIKGFILSMIETAIELSSGAVTGREIQAIIDMGKEMLRQPIHLLETVEDTVVYLAEHYHLMLITKGDLFDQENKIARSGLAEYFDQIEIVSEKNEDTYRSILDKAEVKASHFLMVGNSLKSDILPVLSIGAQAVHIPYEATWAHEVVESHHLDGYEYLEIQRLRDLLPLLGHR